MELTARDIMAGDFGTIRPDAPVKEAVRLIYRGKVRKTGYKPFGIVVTTEEGWPVGMLSMFDILYHLRPPFMNYEALIEFRAERDGLFVLLFTLTFEQTNAQIFSTSIETSHDYMHTLIR